MTLKCDRLAEDVRLSVPPAICEVCKQGFFKETSFQKVCRRVKCQRGYVASLGRAKKAERRADRARLAELDPRRRQKALKATQAIVNRFVRMRDAHLPCISCGRNHEGSWDAGHYLTTGARPELRFHEDNIHRQCVPCNQHKSGNLVLYRVGLIAKIGLERVEALEGPHPPAKWSIEDLQAIQRHYKARVKELEAA